MRRERLISALHSISHSLRSLGNADAATPMGAVEAFGVVVKEDVCSALREAGESIQQGLSEISTSIDGHADAVKHLADAIYAASTFKR